MDMPVLAEKQELISFSSVRTQDGVWKNYCERWRIGIQPMNVTLHGTTALGQNKPVSNGNKIVRLPTQISKNGASPSDAG